MLIREMSDGPQVEIDGRTYPLVVRKNRRAKKLRLRVEAPGKITLTVPHRNSIRTALDFLRSEGQWLQDQLEKLPSAIPFQPGGSLMFRGKYYQLGHKDQLRGLVEITDDHIVVPGLIEHYPRRITDWLKSQARIELTKAANDHARALGTPFLSLRVRDTKTRWGSCSARGALNFSWRLILAPEHVLRYVVIHEVCHLTEHNHSPAFWRLVKARAPEYSQAQDWLKMNGAALHAYGKD